MQLLVGQRRSEWQLYIGWSLQRWAFGLDHFGWWIRLPHPRPRRKSETKPRWVCLNCRYSSSGVIIIICKGSSWNFFPLIICSKCNNVRSLILSITSLSFFFVSTLWCSIPLTNQLFSSFPENVELPLRQRTLAAFRGYEIVTLLSTSGISVECIPDLSGCVVKISGFYHGQIRGLLGNGNGEPYDDLTIPHGKIVTTEAQFANAYKLSSSCPDVALPQHGAVSRKLCMHFQSKLRFPHSRHMKTPFAPNSSAGKVHCECAIHS